MCKSWGPLHQSFLQISLHLCLSNSSLVMWEVNYHSQSLPYHLLSTSSSSAVASLSNSYYEELCLDWVFGQLERSNKTEGILIRVDIGSHTSRRCFNMNIVEKIKESLYLINLAVGERPSAKVVLFTSVLSNRLTYNSLHDLSTVLMAIRMKILPQVK